MAKKKKSWFYLLKRLFVSETNSRLETERRIRRRCAFGYLTNGIFAKRRLASLSAQSLPTENEHRGDGTIEEATATAASSDEQLLANNCDNQVKEANDHQVFENYVESRIPQSDTCVKDVQVLAAIRIQTAFRAYIARKALRALKGLVRLQAIFRGRAVRRQAITTLKCLQTIVNIQSEVCAKRCEMVKITSQYCQDNNLVNHREKDIKIDLRSQRRWDDSPLSKEEANAIGMSKREAEIKRERIKEYWSSHRRSAESDQRRVTSRRRYLIEQWVDAQLAKREDYNKMDAINSIKSRLRDQVGGKQLKLQKEYQSEGLISPVYIPRRSFHKKQHSIGDESCYTESATVPTYMAATESAKAKTRSMSSPRLRPINVDSDAYSEIYSPYKPKLSPISSIYSETTGITRRIVNPIGLSQWSPSLKSLPGPIKATRSLKDLSLNSDVSIPTWAPSYGSYRLYT